MPILASFIGIEVDDLVFVAEYCGGGFGSKAVAYTLMAIPAHMARKTNRPVMMRISRDEEYAAAARSGLQNYVKMGFRADGRITAVDLYNVQDEGPFDAFIDFIHCGEAVSAVYQPLAMRWQGIPVFTNCRRARPSGARAPTRWRRWSIRISTAPRRRWDRSTRHPAHQRARRHERHQRQDQRRSTAMSSAS